MGFSQESNFSLKKQGMFSIHDTHGASIETEPSERRITSAMPQVPNKRLLPPTSYWPLPSPPGDAAVREPPPSRAREPKVDAGVMKCAQRDQPSFALFSSLLKTHVLRRS